MSSIETQRRQREMFVYILTFAEQSPGLEVSQFPCVATVDHDSGDLESDSVATDDIVSDDIVSNAHSILIRQKIDGKALRIDAESINGMLPRIDQDGQEFIQVNFEAGHKILITKNLIGFKPVLLSGLENTGLPNVVTTPDILNVLDALHDAVLDQGESKQQSEVSSLKRVFEAVILGGELVGFDLSYERSWLKQFPMISPKAIA